MKLDLKKELKNQYSPKKDIIDFLDIPSQQYLAFDGKGLPNGNEGQKAIEALFNVAYKLKFACKAQNKDFVVMPLEGLWWADDCQVFINREKEKWSWTYMIMIPDFINKDEVQNIINALKASKPNVKAEQVYLFQREPLSAAQTLYIGSYDDEGPTIQNIHKSIEEKGFSLHDKHHEIYLSDFRKTPSEKLKTIIRQPYK